MFDVTILLSRLTGRCWRLTSAPSWQTQVIHFVNLPEHHRSGRTHKQLDVAVRHTTTVVEACNCVDSKVPICLTFPSSVRRWLVCPRRADAVRLRLTIASVLKGIDIPPPP